MRYTEPGPTGTRTLSLHDALPISGAAVDGRIVEHVHADFVEVPGIVGRVLEVPRELTGQLAWNFQYTPNDSWDFEDRKSTRLNSSHITISYAVFCLNKKTKH